ncbi:MAG: hypothetical protein AAFR74_05505 [Pseudomonadota bacterium]
MSQALKTRMPRPLTGADKRKAFKTATRSLPKQYASEIHQGMTDDRLNEVLTSVLGIYAGTCGPNAMSICWQGSGLKIWAGWTIQNTHRDKPIFSGKATLRAARDVYGIKQPWDTQIGLFEKV